MKRLIGQLEALGLERVVVVTGHRRHMVRAAVESWSHSLTVDCVFNPSFAATNNAVSLAVALKELRSSYFLLCDADVVLRSRQMLEPLVDAPGDAVIGVRRLDWPDEEAMKVAVKRKDLRIESLGKALSPERAYGESLGVQKIGPALVTPLRRHLEALDESQRRRWYYEDVFRELVCKGSEFRACELPGDGWTEIDTPADLERARRFVARWKSGER